MPCEEASRGSEAQRGKVAKQQDDGGERFLELSDYWQNIAGVIAYAAAKREGHGSSMQAWLNDSPWRSLLLRASRFSQ